MLFRSWRDDAPSQDVLILPPDELGPVLFADMTSVAARAWSALPDDDEANVAAQTESIARRAAIAKFVWPIPHKGLHNRRHRVTAATLILWGGGCRPRQSGDVRRGMAATHQGRGGQALPGGHMVIHETSDAAARAGEEFLE